MHFQIRYKKGTEKSQALYMIEMKMCEQDINSFTGEVITDVHFLYARAAIKNKLPAIFPHIYTGSIAAIK